MGNSTLTNRNDDSEFVYRIPDGTGDMLQLLAWYEKRPILTVNHGIQRNGTKLQKRGAFPKDKMRR